MKKTIKKPEAKTEKETEHKEKHVPTDLEILNRGNIVFSALQALRLNHAINIDRESTELANIYTNMSEPTCAIDSIGELEGGTITKVEVRKKDGEMGVLCITVLKSGKPKYLGICLPTVITPSTTLKLAVKYLLPKTYRHPCVPLHVYTIQSKGKAIFAFPDRKITVSVGKGDEFSLKEAYACAMADYVCGSRDEFERLFERTAKKEKKMTEKEVAAVVSDKTEKKDNQ